MIVKIPVKATFQRDYIEEEEVSRDGPCYVYNKDKELIKVISPEECEKLKTNFFVKYFLTTTNYYR